MKRVLIFGALVVMALVLVAAISVMDRSGSLQEDEPGWCDHNDSFVCTAVDGVLP